MNEAGEKSEEVPRLLIDDKIELTNVVFGIQSRRPIGGDKVVFLRCILFSEYYSDEELRHFVLGSSSLYIHDELAHACIQCGRWLRGRDKETHSILVPRMRNALSLWTNTVPLFPYNRKLLHTMMDLAVEFLGKSDPLCNKLNMNLLHVQGELRLTLSRHATAVPRPASPVIDAEGFLEKFSTQVIGDAMTMNHIRHIKRVEPREFLAKSFTDKKLSPNLVAAADYFNQVSYWAATLVMSSDSTSSMIHIVKFLIRLATKFLNMRNFDLLLAIVSSLNLASVQRLRFVWKKVPPKYLQQLEMLEELMSPLSGYRNYKKFLKESPAAPTIPYLGLFLREITHICDGNPKIIEKEETSTETGADQSLIGGQKEGEEEGEGGEEKREEEEEEEETSGMTEEEMGGEEIDKELNLEVGEGEEGEGGDASAVKGPEDAEGVRVKHQASASSISENAADAATIHHNWERVLLLGSRISEFYFYTRVPYELAPPENVMAATAKLHFRTENELFRMSLMIQPPGKGIERDEGNYLTWSPAEIKEWLRARDMNDAYVELVVNGGLKQIELINHEKLKELGIAHLKDRREVLRILSELPSFQNDRPHFLDKTIYDWTVDDVGEWITHFGLQKEMVRAFKKNGVDGSALIVLDKKKLLEFGVKKLSERSHLLAEINHIIENEGRVPTQQPAIPTPLPPSSLETPPMPLLGVPQCYSPLSLDPKASSHSPSPHIGPLRSMDRRRSSQLSTSPALQLTGYSSALQFSSSHPLELIDPPERTATPDLFRNHQSLLVDEGHKAAKTKIAKTKSSSRLLGKFPFIRDEKVKGEASHARTDQAPLKKSPRHLANSESSDETSPRVRRETKGSERSTVCSEGAGIVGAPLRVIRFHLNGGTIDTKMPGTTTLFQVRQRIKRRFGGNYQIYIARGSIQIHITTEIAYSEYLRSLSESDPIELHLIARDREKEENGKE